MELMANFKEKIKDQSVLILGDVMLDYYLHGKADRISPEAPVPIVALKSTEYRLGGAANVALNIAALGATPLLCGIVGKDATAVTFFNEMEKCGLNSQYIISGKDRTTTKKSRILANNQQLLRVDEESTQPISNEEVTLAMVRLEELFAKQCPDVVLFQDYNKGFLTTTLIAKAIELAKKYDVPTVVDPKFLNFKAFVGVDLFKPNLKELQEGLGKTIELSEAGLSKASKELSQTIQAKSLLITLSEHGVYCYENGGGTLIPTYPREIVDVCGAGDAVISICAVALGLGLDFATIGKMANLAGGLVCESLGVVPIPMDSFLNELSSLSLLNSSNF